MRRSHAVLLTASLYGLALALIGLWPAHVDQSLGLNRYEFYTPLEFGANVALFVPLGALAAVFLPRSRWWWAVLVGLLISVAIESAQSFVLPGRTASPQDVVANVTGTTIGVVLVVLLRRRRRGVSPDGQES